MKRIKVDTDSIGNAKKASADGLQELVKAVSEMNKSVTELNAVWKGSNHDQFEMTYAERYKQIQGTLAELSDFLNGISEAKKKYESCESDVSGLAAF